MEALKRCERPLYYVLILFKFVKKVAGDAQSITKCSFKRLHPLFSSLTKEKMPLFTSIYWEF